MARSKSTTTTPKTKKFAAPQSAPAKTAARTIPSSSPEISDADSAPVAEATTPARKQPKRKAPLDDDAASTPAKTSNKKPKVSIHTEQVTVTSTTASGKKSTHTHRNVRIEIPVASTPKGKHTVFNDDDNDGDNGPSEFFTPQEDVKTKGLEEQLLVDANTDNKEEEGEEDSEDDDEAPEAVSTSTAAAQAAKVTQAAERAAERQQDDERRKRQERDAKFKKQAEARKLQQQKSVAAAAAAAVAEEEDSDDDEPAVAKQQPASRLATSMTNSSRKRFDRRTLPSVLPDVFLASDSEADEEDADAKTSAKPKKITFNTAARQVASAEQRHPADQRVGSTVYRVMKKQGETKLAPRGGKYSRNAREMLLARGRTVPRTSVKKKSFLTKS